MNKAPAFQFYPDKALSGTVHLSPPAFKAYWMVLWWMWLHSEDQCSMMDTDQAWRIATLIEKDEALSTVRGEIMSPAFPLLELEGEKLFSNGLRKEAKKQRAWRKKCSKGGKNAAKSRPHSHLKEGKGSTTTASRVAQVKGCTPSPSSTPSPNKEQTPIDWDDIKRTWNGLAQAHGYSAIQRLTKARQRRYLARLKAWPDLWDILVREMPLFADFVKDGNWFGFDWWVKSDTNFAKLAEGNYRKPGAEPPPVFHTTLGGGQ